MSAAIEQMLKSYDVENMYNRKNAMKEIMQEKQDVEPFLHDTSSLNLWSADFFRKITEGITDC